MRSNQCRTELKVLEGYLRGKISTIRRSGKELTPPQRETLLAGLQLLLYVWADILLDSDGYTNRWVKPWFDALTRTDLTVTVAVLDGASQLVVSSLNDESLASYDDFKDRLTAIDHSAGAIIAPAKRIIEAWVADKANPRFFCGLRSMFEFILRLDLPGLDDLEDAALSRFRTVDENLSSVTYHVAETRFFSTYFPKTVLRELYENFSPSHGPGVSSDFRGPISYRVKMLSVGRNCWTDYYDSHIGSASSLPWIRTPFSRVSKITTVPKNIMKRRTICAEPVTMMWYQKGFESSIRNYVYKHVYLHRRYNFEDQSKAHELARLGSIDGSYATIDSSDASDTFLREMLLHWTKSSALYPILLGCGTKTVLMPDKSTIELLKFATMGNGLTFITESLGYSAEIEATIRSLGDVPQSSDYFVHGDDIAIESKYAQALIDRMTENGHKVNIRKSFYKIERLNFREACGKEYLNGVEVTPLRISRRFQAPENLEAASFELVSQYVALANTYFERSPMARSLVLRWIMEYVPVEYRPLFGYRWLNEKTPDRPRCNLHRTSDSDGKANDTFIWSYAPTNHHLLSPFCNRYNNIDWPHGVPKKGPRRQDEVSVKLPRCSPEWRYDYVRLHVWLRATSQRKVVGPNYEPTVVDIESPALVLYGRTVRR